MLKSLSLLLCGLAFQVQGAQADAFCQGSERLACLWNKQLAQTFVDEWLVSLKKKSGQGTALEAEIEKGIDALLEENGVLFTPAQEEIVSALPKTPLYGHLKAWTSFRRGLAAKESLDALPKLHPWRGRLARSVSLAMARNGMVRAAISLVGTEVEAAAASGKKVQAETLSENTLQLARLYYQYGDLDEAEKWYELVPVSTNSYLKAQEELLWVWLRKGNSERLRGTLASLTLPFFEDKLAPEIYVVRAISNLKLCHYEDSKKDFDAFVRVNEKWAKPMEEAPRLAAPPRPPELDWYTAMVERGLERREREVAAVKALGWTESAQALAANQAWLKGVLVKEYRRQWRNANAELREAIVKMRFVKVELHQEILRKHQVAEDTEFKRAAQKNVQASLSRDLQDKDLVFPYDGSVWPDELFRLRSNAFNGCL